MYLPTYLYTVTQRNVSGLWGLQSHQAPHVFPKLNTCTYLSYYIVMYIYGAFPVFFFSFALGAPTRTFYRYVPT